MRFLLVVLLSLGLAGCAQQPVQSQTESKPVETAKVVQPPEKFEPKENLTSLTSTEHPFDRWLELFRQEAQAKGISDQTLNAALDGIKPIERVIQLDRAQPESRITFLQYQAKVVTQARISQGRRLRMEHAALLEEVERKSGVPADLIVALWGIETSFGGFTGGFDVVPALATLAWEGRRAAFFRNELLAALAIIDQGHISASDMRGSWAGAMGQCQFMPTTFARHAIDFDGDGRKDIWQSLPDVFGSAANYLKAAGWKKGSNWGQKVMIPAAQRGSVIKWAEAKTKKTYSQWAKIGIRPANPLVTPVANMSARIIAPQGQDGPFYLVNPNYEVILDWNRSNFFAVAVGRLADAIKER